MATTATIAPEAAGFKPLIAQLVSIALRVKGTGNEVGVEEAA